MNKLFHLYFDRFIVLYLDDIIIYCNTLEKHLEHFRQVFYIPCENKLTSSLKSSSLLNKIDVHSVQDQK